MSMRSYSGLIVLETLFDSTPATEADLTSFCSTVFSPFVQVVEEDCKTTLGEIVTVNYELAGKVDLSTGLIIDKTRIEYLLSQGVYSTSVRTLSTCVSKGGICQKCYHASRQKQNIPEIGHSVQVTPEYVVATEVSTLLTGGFKASLSLTKDLYDDLYVYSGGTLLSDTSYISTDDLLTLNNPVPTETQILIRYITTTRAPFLAWLADTYSGALLGMKPLPYPKLPIRKSLLAGLIPMSMVELLITKLEKIKSVPEDAMSYLSEVKDPLEKALLVIALLTIYLNVS